MAITGLSNATGFSPDLATIIKKAKDVGAYSLIDGAQLIMHDPINVAELDCDFFVCSGHKMYGPTGIGVLYGKQELLEQFKPQRFGGEMIEKVSFEQSSFASLPFRLEGGTPHIAGVLGLGAAIDLMKSINWQEIKSHEQALIKQVKTALQTHPEITIIGDHQHKGIVSFTIKDCHHQDIATLLDKQGIAVRVGHHCAMPLMQALKLAGVIRVSVAMYNTTDDITHFAQALSNAIRQLRTAETSTKPNTQTVANNQPNIDEITTRFSQCRSWEEKYRQILLLGKKQPKADKQLRNPESEVHGCESQVWLYHHVKTDVNNNRPLHYFSIDSDARIIKGLAALLLSRVNGKTGEEIQQLDYEDFFEQLGLLNHFSPSRGNGLRAIMAQIKRRVTHLP